MDHCNRKSLIVAQPISDLLPIIHGKPSWIHSVCI